MKPKWTNIAQRNMAKFSIVISASVVKDTKFVYDQLEKVKPGLGEELYQHLLRTLKKGRRVYTSSGSKIQRPPIAYGMPYTIVSAIDGKTIRVVRIIHHTRKLWSRAEVRYN